MDDPKSRRKTTASGKESKKGPKDPKKDGKQGASKEPSAEVGETKGTVESCGACLLF